MTVDDVMRKVPKGKLVTINQIRELLAARHHAYTACPITTGIFAGVAARAADEDEQAGKKRITPYWRTLKEGGEVNPEYPGGLERAARSRGPRGGGARQAPLRRRLREAPGAPGRRLT